MEGTSVRTNSGGKYRTPSRTRSFPNRTCAILLTYGLFQKGRVLAQDGVSMSPGVTTRPAPSISTVPDGTRRSCPIAAIFPSRMRRSASLSSRPAAVQIEAFRMTVVRDGSGSYVERHAPFGVPRRRSSRRSWAAATLAIAKSAIAVFFHWEPPDNLCILYVRACQAKAHGAESRP